MRQSSTNPIFLSLMFFLLAFCNTLPATETFTFSYVSDPGDFIGQGGTATWTEADGNWTASRNGDNGVGYSFVEAPPGSDWFLDFAAANGVELTVGTHLDAERFPLQSAGHPGLSVTGEGRECSILSGEFTVNSIDYDFFGQPIALEASFEQHCELAIPALTGTMTHTTTTSSPSNGNILVARKQKIYEYTTSGNLVQSIPVGREAGQIPANTNNLRDLTVDENGKLHTYNGTFTPFLSSGTLPSGIWTHTQFSEWSTVSNITYGVIDSYRHFIFTTDMNTAGAAASGIVRFDSINGFSAQRFATSEEYIDLTVGLDEILYALRQNQNTVDRYSPLGMTLLDTVVLGNNVRGIAVNATGEIFGAAFDGSIYHFSASGIQMNSHNPGLGSLADIDLSNTGGNLVVGAANAMVAVTTESLSSSSIFQTAGGGFDTSFVSFADPALLATTGIFSDGFESGDTGAWTSSVP